MPTILQNNDGSFKVRLKKGNFFVNDEWLLVEIQNGVFIYCSSENRSSMFKTLEEAEKHYKAYKSLLERGGFKKEIE
jgi:hypothetical protein